MLGWAAHAVLRQAERGGVSLCLSILSGVWALEGWGGGGASGGARACCGCCPVGGAEKAVQAVSGAHASGEARQVAGGEGERGG